MWYILLGINDQFNTNISTFSQAARFVSSRWKTHLKESQYKWKAAISVFFRCRKLQQCNCEYHSDVLPSCILAPCERFEASSDPLGLQYVWDCCIARCSRILWEVVLIGRRLCLTFSSFCLFLWNNRAVLQYFREGSEKGSWAFLCLWHLITSASSPPNMPTWTNWMTVVQRYDVSWNCGDVTRDSCFIGVYDLHINCLFSANTRLISFSCILKIF